MMPKNNRNNSQSGYTPIVVILFIALIFGAFYFFKSSYKSEVNITLQKNSQTTAPSSSQPITSLAFTPLPNSGLQSYPIVKDGKLLLISIENPHSSLSIETKAESGGFALYLGTKDPLPSPNLGYTAFLKDKQLNIITADGKTTVKIPETLLIEYLSGWSPDSTRLIAYSPKDDIVTATQGYGGAPEQAQFNPNREPAGYYLIDLKKGTVSPITPLNNFKSWIDNNTLLAVQEQYPNPPIYIVFDLKNYSANYKLLEKKFDEYFAPQFSFTPNGKKWALTLGNTENSKYGSSSKIILANYPSIKGTEIDKDTWAKVQSPIVSPNGEKVAYTKHTGGDSYHTHLWENGSIKPIGEGQPDLWIDNNRFIYNNLDQPRRVFIYNTQTSQSSQLF